MLIYWEIAGSWTIGSSALIWAAYSVPSCTSCWVDTPPHAVRVPATSAAVANRLIRAPAREWVLPPLGQDLFHPWRGKSVKLLTLARDLGRRAAREREHLFVAEGVRAVEELVRSDLRIRGALHAPQLAENARGEALLAALRARADDVVGISEREFSSAAGTESPQGILAIGEIPRRDLPGLITGDRTRVLVLDAVQDPGNVG